MYLRRLKVQGFRSLYNHTPTNGLQDAETAEPSFDAEPGVEIHLDRLTVLIGCNDAGKSSVLDAIDIVMGNGRPEIDDFHRLPADPTADEDGDGARRVDVIKVLIEFQLEGDRDDEASQYAVNGLLTVRAVYTPSHLEMAYLGESPRDQRLAQDFRRLKAPEQKALILELDGSALQGLSNSDQRLEWLVERALEAPKRTEWIPVPRGFSQLLPRFERYSTMDYDAPEGLVMKTLRQVYESVVFEETESDGLVGRRPVQVLRDLKREVDGSIHAKVQELLEYIRRYNPRVIDISFDPTLDFSSGLKAGQFQVDDGHGLMYLSKVGDGTKRRMFMAVVDWDREVTVAQASSQHALSSIIRGYDEPDTNLDYQAQHTMYQSISDIVQAPNSRVQALVCTHSPRLIDRAPAGSIRLLQWDDGCTSVSQLRTGSDPEIERFLSETARELGLSNTLMFYERCFVLIEGATELNALPLLYRTMYGHSMLEDGIRIISVQSNGAFKEFFRLLSRNRQEMTLVLADLDTETSREGRRLTKAILQDSHFDHEFVGSHVHYVPTASIRENGEEFEAAFPNTVIARCLRARWPRKQGNWTDGSIEELRTIPGKKFSDVLKGAVWSEAIEESRSWSKPDFGSVLGMQCLSDEVPVEVQLLFEHARRIAGCAR